ncbi:SHOCT domain-containing protein [Echinicola shivajiensis]|uniref:SHOCT domain-containing protein n=1 Tax=Echinicola shivajiensis TaxID=1035916 RepID=UPI001BFC911C|nr:SHOCT domain-containing protein [Echinicola shivajiensis]
MHEWNWSNWGMAMIWLAWIPLIALAVWLIARQKDEQQISRESPLDLLKRRYANGEISKEEYEERKKVLKKD